MGPKSTKAVENREKKNLSLLLDNFSTETRRAISLEFPCWYPLQFAHPHSGLPLDRKNLIRQLSDIDLPKNESAFWHVFQEDYNPR